MKLDPKILGLAGGVLYGGILFLLTLIAMIMGLGADLIILLMGLIPIFTISLTGSIIALIYGFIMGYILLFIFGSLHDFFEG